MPTFESLAGFDRTFALLTRSQQDAFADALRAAVAQLPPGSGRGLPGARVRDTDDVWAMEFAAGSYVTWQYGSARVPGEVHVIWRSIGTGAGEP